MMEGSSEVKDGNVKHLKAHRVEDKLLRNDKTWRLT